MSDVFISYSRKDIAFARLLHNALQESELDTWIDWQDIPPSADWLAEVYEAIEGADTFIFVISETSVISDICQLEIAHAEQNNKRLIPIVVNQIDPGSVHPTLAALNWIFFKEEDEFQPAVQALIEAIQTDQVWVKAHTRLQVRALEWERSQHLKGYLLHGQDLATAEAWLSQAGDKDPQPTALQTQYILASRQDATRRQRITLIGVAAALVVAVGLGILAWTQRNQAVSQGNMRATAQHQAEAASTEAVAQRDEAQRQTRLARSGFFAAESLSHLEDSLDLAALLSIEAINNADTLPARGSLLSALQYYPQLDRYLHEHAGRVGAVAFHPDGELLVTAGCAEEDPVSKSCSEGEILLWDVQQGELIERLEALHTGFMSDLAFSPDGSMMASSSWGGVIALWDTETWQLIGEPIFTEYTGRLLGIEFYPDGETLVSSHEASLPDPVSGTNQISAEVYFWDTAAGEMIERVPFIQQMAFTSLAFNPDGETFVTAMNSAPVVRLWDAGSRQIIPSWFPNLDRVPHSLAFNPAGTILALGNFDGSIIFWDMESDQQIGRELLGHSSRVTSLAYSPDGKTLASSSEDRTIILWDVDSGEMLADPLHGHGESIASLAFHPDGDLLVSGADDHKVILWNLDQLSRIAGLDERHSAPVWDAAYSPDGNFLASAGEDGGIVLRDLRPGRDDEILLTGHEGHIYSLAFSPDGSVLASGGQYATVRLWDPSTGEQIGEPLIGHTDPVISLAFSPDGRILASGSMDRTIRLWDVKTGEAIGEPIEDHPGMINNLDFNPLTSELASSSCSHPDEGYCQQGEIGIWEISAEEVKGKTFPAHTHYIYGLDFSPDGSLLATGSADKTILLWEVASGEVLGEPIEWHADGVTSLAFSPDGKTLASGGFDRTVILMDMESRQAFGGPLSGHTGTVSGLTWHPDGLKLASAGHDSTVIIWDLDPASWIIKACQRAGRDLSPAEWAIYHPGEAYRETCPGYE